MNQSKKRQAQAVMAYLPQVREITKHRYGVDSQSDPLKSYTVQRTPYTRNWHCECGHFHHALTRSRDNHCHHIKACIMYHERQYADRNIERVPVIYSCPTCHGTVLKKAGLRTLSGCRKRQIYKCGECDRRFTLRVGGMLNYSTEPEIISESLELYASGVSYRKIQRHLEDVRKVKLSHVAVMRWVHRLSDVLTEYVDTLYPEMSDVWSLDEMDQLVNGTQPTKKGFRMWVWSIIDPHTKYLLATMVSKRRETADARGILQKGKAVSREDPAYIITDSLRTYEPAIRKEFGARVAHIKTKAVRDGFTNWPVERLHNEYRENTKTRRGLGNDESAQRFFDFLRLYHNFVKPSEGLGGRTPAEAAGLGGPGEGDRFLNLLNRANDARPDFMRALGKRAANLNVVFEGGTTRVTQKCWIRRSEWNTIGEILALHGFERIDYEGENLWVRSEPASLDDLSN